MKMKNCIRCKKELSYKHFNRDKTKFDGYKPYCKKCRKEDSKLYYKNNREILIIKEKNKRTPIFIKDKKLYDSKRKLQQKNSWLKRRYNINLTIFNQMKKEQNNKCLICSQKFIKNTKICVDHDHKSGEVRGLLCNKCNMALGLFNDEINILKQAIKYLEVLNDT